MMPSNRPTPPRLASRTLPVAGLLAAFLLASVPHALAACVGGTGNGVVESGEDCDDGSQNGTTNSCCTPTCTFAPKAPDVIVGDLPSVVRWGNSGGISAYSVGTTSCNLGTCWLNWFSGNAEHPVIGQNLYRLKNGRFEHIGQSWLKHGFTALQQTVCATPENPCIPASPGTHLGVFCSDPYDASLNGSQPRLGPKYEVNPFTAVYPYPAHNGTCSVSGALCRCQSSQTSCTSSDCPAGQTCNTTASGATGNLYKRLQVHDADIDPALNSGAQYWVEGHYVAHDDALAKNQANNASYRPCTVSGSGTNFTISTTASTVRQQAGIHAWKATDPLVTETLVGVVNDGLYWLAAKATSLGGGVYHYEYALQNVNNDRGAQSFSVAIPTGAVVSNVGFHDVDYHSGEPFSGTDWTPSVTANAVTWASQTFAVNPNANALRWGTLYNFRFDANVAPVTGNVTVGLFKPGSPGSVTASTVVPNVCNTNGVCDIGEDCINCAADCFHQGGGSGCCGNTTCEPGENSCRCRADCGPPPASESVCGNAADDDCDGLTDCVDPDCCTSAACAGSDGDGDHFAAVCDCNNADGSVYPGAPQLCDGKNNDCLAPGWPAVPASEADGDGDSVRVCGGDCDDADPLRYPGNPEACDGIDNDCAGGVPANEADGDGDSVRGCGGDCDDADPLRYPGNPEVCDGIDNDCSGGIPSSEVDGDGDTLRGCDGDCDDTNGLVWSTPGEVRDLTLAQAGGITTLTWTPPEVTGCVTPRYDTLSSLVPNDFMSGATCVETDGTDTTSDDLEDPPPGSAACYLVRCENDCPSGEGTFGTDSGGTPRAGRTCP